MKLCACLFCVLGEEANPPFQITLHFELLVGFASSGHCYKMTKNINGSKHLAFGQLHPCRWMGTCFSISTHSLEMLCGSNSPGCLSMSSTFFFLAADFSGSLLKRQWPEAKGPKLNESLEFLLRWVLALSSTSDSLCGLFGSLLAFTWSDRSVSVLLADTSCFSIAFIRTVFTCDTNWIDLSSNFVLS